MGGRVEEVQMPIQGLALRGAERESAAQLINLAEIDLNTLLPVPKLTPWLEKWWRTGAGEGGKESHREMRKGSRARRWEWSEPKDTWETALLGPAYRALLTQVYSLESSPCAN